MKKFCRQGWVVVAALGLSACGGKDKEAEPKASVTAASDIVALRAENRSGYAKLDAKSAGLFGEIFGGTDSTSVASYLDARAKYFVDKDDPEVLVEGTPISRIVGDDDQDNGSIQVGAMNIGAVLWLESEVNRRPYTLEVHGNASTMTDSRNGLVVLGPGYRRDYPVAVRQSILIHEARHSDCTGGISRAQLGAIAADQSKIMGMSCLHTHIKCESGDYKGELACDNEGWGAYGIQEVFVRAVLSDDGIENSSEYLMLENMYADTASRLVNGRYGRPDMSSSGVVQ
jgi:hypothetical protein